MDTDLHRIAAAVRPSVVQVLPGSSGGAGVVLSRGGQMVVVTNAHVALGARSDHVRVLDHRGRTCRATIGQVDTARDLALLTLSSAGADDFVPAMLGDSAALRPGQLVLAIGHPFGLMNAVTTGIVHAVGSARAVWEPGRRSRQLSWIQADIRLAPGNSGGPLLDMAGRVVGINTMVAGGLALAVPATDIRAQLRARGEAIPA